MLTVLILLVGVRAATADCTASISASPDQGKVTLTATASGGNCSRTNIHIYDPVSGFDLASNSCPPGSCTVTTTVSTRNVRFHAVVVVVSAVRRRETRSFPRLSQVLADLNTP